MWGSEYERSQYRPLARATWLTAAALLFSYFYDYTIGPVVAWIRGTPAGPK